MGAAFMLVPLASGLSAVTLGTVMISATAVEVFVLRRPPIAIPTEAKIVQQSSVVSFNTSTPDLHNLVAFTISHSLE